MNSVAAALRVANLDDLPFIMATERMPGFERLVSRGSEAEHLAALARPDHAYLVGSNSAREPAGFAIVRDLDNAHGNVCLKRIAVTSPGHGFGGLFLDLVVDWVFSTTQAHRFWLDALADNARARHVYRSHGFAEEGVSRAAYRLPDGRRADLVVMSMIRDEWLDRRRPV